MSSNSPPPSDRPFSRLSVLLADLDRLQKKDTPGVSISDDASTILSVELPTPTHSTRTDEAIMGDVNKVEEVVPWAGQKVIIREKDTHRTIVVVGGQLRIDQDISIQLHGGFQWEIVEKEGWLGFRNSVSGMHIGRDDDFSLKVDVPHHQEHEFFCIRRHPEGGYILMMRDNGPLRQVSIKHDKSLHATRGGEEQGTRWEFVRVPDFPAHSLCHLMV